MSHKKDPNAKTTLTMNYSGTNYKSKSTIPLTLNMTATIERIQMLLEGMTGIDAAVTLIITRALQSYESELLTLLDKATRMSRTKEPSDTALINLQADLQTERERLFETANRPQHRFKLAYGSMPTIEALTGHSYDKAQAVERTVTQLSALIEKLKAEK